MKTREKVQSICIIIMGVVIIICSLVGCGFVEKDTKVVYSCGNMIVQVNNDVYFQTMNLNGTGSFLYKRSNIGKENVLIAQLPDSGRLHVVDDSLYLSTHDKGIYKLDLGGSNIVKISDAQGDYHIITSDGIYGQKISYHTNLGWQGEIYHMHLDGSEYITLSTDSGTCLTFYDEWLYYFSYTDEAIVRIKPDGTSKKILVGNLHQKANSNFSIENFTGKYSMVIQHDWIYYIDEYGVYKVRTDGSGHTDLNIRAKGLAVMNDQIVLLDKNDGADMELSSISVVDQNGGNKRTIIKSGGWMPIVMEDYIYFYIAPSLYRIKIDGTDFEQIF